MFVAALAVAASVGCVPAGATPIAASPPTRLYRFLRGPITACDGTSAPVELGGWDDEGKPPLPWPRTTRVVALSGGCVALDDFQATAYGGAGTVTLHRLSDRTSWGLGSYTLGQLQSTRFGPITLTADCSASWPTTETAVGRAPTTTERSAAAPTDPKPIRARAGVRPRPVRAPTLVRTASGAITVGITLDRAPRGITVIVAGQRLALRTSARSARLRLPAKTARRLKPGRYRVTVIACNAGCATSTRTATLQ